MKSRRRDILAFVALSLLCSGGLARAQTAANCNGPPSGSDLSKVALGSVAVAKVNFIADGAEKPGCPSSAANCVKRAFLVEKNTVVFESGAANGYVCAGFVAPGGRETDGWLPRAAIAPLASAPDWIGTWQRDTSAQIVIVRQPGGAAHLSGSATAGQGSATNEGDIDASIDPARQIQSFAIDGDKQVPFDKAGQYDCAAALKQLGPYLVVSDNNNCGGMNVTFSGLYIRR